MNNPDDVGELTNVTSYTEFKCGNKNIGMFGVDTLENDNLVEFIKNISIFYNIGSKVYDFYFLTQINNQPVASSATLKVHYPRPYYEIQPTLDSVRSAFTNLSNDYLRKTSNNPTLATFFRENLDELELEMPTDEDENNFGEEFDDEDDTNAIMEFIKTLNDFFKTFNALYDIINSKETNVIICIESKYTEYIELFLRGTCRRVLNMIDDNIKFTRNEKLVSFLFENVHVAYRSTFIESASNCGADRMPAGVYTRFLLTMCDTIPLKNIEFIYGPVTYAEFTNGSQRIAVFGEVHKIPVNNEINKSNTVSVPSLVKIMIESFPENFYDLFLEMRYIDRTHETGGGLTSFNHFFEDCLTVVKNCPFDNIRAHYTDYRSLFSGDGIYDEFLVAFHAIEDDPYAEQTGAYFEMSNLEIVFDRVYESVLNLIDNDRKLKPAHGSQLHQFILINLDKINKEKKTFLDYRTMIINIIKMYSLVMDMYTLIRVFKTYKVDPHTNQPATATNIIIYAGEAHAKIYREYIDLILNFKAKFRSQQYASHMMDVRSIKTESFLFNP